MRIFFLIAILACAAGHGDYTAKDYSSLIGMTGFSDSLLKMHFTLYAGYVKNTNELLAKIKSMDSPSYEFGALKRRLGWEFDGMRLHELCFDNLGGNGVLDPQSSLYNALIAQFNRFKDLCEFL